MTSVVQDMKTGLMFRLESRYGAPIEVLLLQGSGREVAARLGITESCVSRWKQRFGLPGSRVTNLSFNLLIG
jgi:transposase